MTGPNSDRLNPYDIFELDNADLETDAQLLASWLADGNRFSREPFWDLHGTALHSAINAYVASDLPPAERNLETARKILMDDDTVYGLAVILDKVGENHYRLASEVRRRRLHRIGYAAQGQDTSFDREVRLGLNSSAFGRGEYLLRFEAYNWRGQTDEIGWVRLQMR